MSPGYSVLVQQLQQLNTNVENLYAPASKIADKGLDFNTLITVLAGIVGVCVGAYISYYFSKRLSDNSAKARIAIQRKNFIFGRLFKELVEIRKIFNYIPKDSFYFELNTRAFYSGWDSYESFYFDRECYPKPDYTLWTEMKEDIRKTYVSNDLREELDALEEAFAKYAAFQQSFLDETEALKKREETKMIEEYQREPQHRNSRIGIDTRNSFYKQATTEKIVDENIRSSGIKNETIISEMRRIVGLVLALEIRGNVIQSFDEVKLQLDETFNKLESIIQIIVDKYEYGDTLL